MELSSESTPKVEEPIIANPRTAVEPSINPIVTSITNETAISSSEETINMLPQDGGAKAWLVVLGSFFIHSIVFAPTEYIFGVFELHYQTIFEDAKHSSVAFIGTAGSAVTYLSGFLAGIIADRFGFRLTSLAGTLIMFLSLILASFAKELWHLYITQGVLFGIGASLSYYPAIAVPSHHFTKKRGLATGLAVSGVGVGGLVLAPMTDWFVGKVGVFWTLRILALLCLVVCGLASFLLMENKGHSEISQVSKEEKLAGNEKSNEEISKDAPGFFAAVKVFKDPRFLSLSLAEFILSIAFLIPLYYMQTYAVFIGLSAQQGALILGLSNGASFVGRIALGTISDYVSNTAVLLLCSWMTAFTILVLWTLSHSFGLLLVVGLSFGFFGGGYISLMPVAISRSFGTKQIASTIGLMYAAGGFGMLGGAPLAGFLLDVTKPNISYLPVTLASGLALVIGSLFITLWAYLQWKVKRSTRK